MIELEREILEKLIEIDRIRRNGESDYYYYEITMFIGVAMLMGFLFPDLLLAILPFGLLVFGICFLCIGIGKLYDAWKLNPKRLATAEAQYEELMSRKRSKNE